MLQSASFSHIPHSALFFFFFFFSFFLFPLISMQPVLAASCDPRDYRGRCFRFCGSAAVQTKT